MNLVLLDYATLRVIWWLLLGVLLIAFAIMDGFDLGVGMLLPFVAKTDEERRVVINTVGPVWEGNQVWLIVGGGAIFAAWPPLYAVSFSGFYLAMFVILLALIVRPLGFKYRSKMPSQQWRDRWDWALCLCGFVPALISGVAMGNVLLGVPFHIDETHRIFYTGNFFGLLQPFALLAGLLSVIMLIAHGAAMLVLKTEGAVAARAARYGSIAALLSFAVFLLGGIWLAYGLPGYAVTSPMQAHGASNPLLKTVEITAAGGWLSNFQNHGILWLAPLAGLLGALATVPLLRAKRGGLAFIVSAVSITGIILSVGIAAFPMLLPSVTQPGSSLTLWDSSSSHLTLWIMLIASIIFLPIVVSYTSWVYRVMRGKVTAKDMDANPNAY